MLCLGFPPRTPFVTPVLPGPGSDIRMKMGWKILTKKEKSGVWFFQNAGSLWGRRVLPLLTGAVDWVWKGSYRTAWAVPGGSSCSCSYAYGRGPAVGPHTEGRCLATASLCVEGHRSPDAALVCKGRSANGCEPEPKKEKGFMCSLALR